MIGQTISHYKILEKLGEGGMGVVYKAEDTKLKRTVALKFLVSDLMRDPDAKKQLITEARAASALDHPNICTIYEVNETENVRPGKRDKYTYISMAYYDGETLREKIESGSLSFNEIIIIVKQIAEGLKEAHAKGIIHCDIKPANIMITDEGRIKIMDFGLAKAVKDTTVSEKGTTKGTITYMSPEQVRGEEIDHRSDIWSLGVMFYEMLTGELPFKGEYKSAIFYSILNNEPLPITSRRIGIPEELKGILGKLLAKDPGSRYQHIDELPVDLGIVETTISDTTRSTKTLSTFDKPKQKSLFRGVFTLLFSLVIIVLAIVLFNRTGEENIPESNSLKLTKTMELEINNQDISIALSPDGRYLVFSAICSGIRQLCLHEIGSSEETSKPIKGTENGKNPFISDNGEWLGFFVDDKMKKVKINSENEPETICTVRPTSKGAYWDQAGMIIFAPTDEDGLYRISSDIVSTQSYRIIAEQVTFPDSRKSEHAHMWPQMLPDSTSVLYIVKKSEAYEAIYQNSHIAVENLENQNRYKNLSILEIPYARYIAETKYLIYYDEGQFKAYYFDPDNIEDEKLLDHESNVYVNTVDGVAQFAVSDTGSIFYVPEDYKLGPFYGMIWKDRNYREEPLNFVLDDKRINN
ncbi:protein kinase, partial [candidate division KSB1 bacterium]